MNIYKIFKQAAVQFSSNIAIVNEKKSISYKELSLAINNKANELERNGFQKGDKILVFIPMSIELYVFLLATFKIGAIAVFVDEWSNKKRLADCLTKVPCKGFAGSTKARILRFFYRPLRKIPNYLNNKFNVTESVYSEALEMSENDTALVTFTTGSTSIPKAANRTHGFLTAQYLTLIKELKTAPHHIDLIGLPIVVLCNLGTGATSVLPNYNLKEPNKIDSNKVIQHLEKHSVNRIINSPSFFIKMEHSENKNKNIQSIFTGGAPVFPSDISSFKKTFPNAEISILYGSTEAEPISRINAVDLLLEEENIVTDGLCVGQISEDIHVKIIKGYEKEIILPDELKSIEVKDGEIGEILVSGNHVLKEYLNSEIDTQKNKVKCGEIVWHRTGDAGKMINKKLYLQGRTSQLFNSNKKTYSPFIYEYLLNKIEDIEIGTVLFSGKVMAVIQSKLNANKEKLESFILNDFPEIDEVVFISKIPLDARHNSKIDYELIKFKD